MNDPHKWVTCSICGGEHWLGQCPGWNKKKRKGGYGHFVRLDEK